LPYGILLTILDILLVVHAAKTGRFSPWGYVILFLPGIGAVAYVIVELAPEWLGSYRGQKARRGIATALNPTGRYRALKDELAVVDTIANRAALAEECLKIGKPEEALENYQAILGLPMGDEASFMIGKARAEFALQRAADAAATLEEVKRRWPETRSADGHLLYARALEASGRTAEALANYDNVGRYYPGAEPRVRAAELLMRLGRAEEAKTIAEDVVRTLGRAPKHVRRNQREWFEAAQKLAR
jgi:hypothetical protein